MSTYKRGHCPNDVKNKIKNTYKEKYNSSYINPSSKLWLICDNINNDSYTVLGLSKWARQNNFNISTVK